MNILNDLNIEIYQIFRIKLNVRTKNLNEALKLESWKSCDY